MNEEKVRKILGKHIVGDKLVAWIWWAPGKGQETATLNVNLTIDELRAIAWWMENKGDK